MSEKKPQTLANHARLDPWFHYFLVPLAFLTFFASAYGVFRHPHSLVYYLLVLITLFLIVSVTLMRVYSLRVQDRVIRLEERLRLGALLSAPLAARIPELTERQLIALRFASDGEVSGLTERTLKENLPPAEIKKLIQSWRPDYWRV